MRNRSIIQENLNKPHFQSSISILTIWINNFITDSASLLSWSQWASVILCFLFLAPRNGPRDRPISLQYLRLLWPANMLRKCSPFLTDDAHHYCTTVFQTPEILK